MLRPAPLDNPDTLAGILRIKNVIELNPSKIPIPIDDLVKNPDTWFSDITTGKLLYIPITTDIVVIDQIVSDQKKIIRLSIEDIIQWQLQGMNETDIDLYHSQFIANSDGSINLVEALLDWLNDNELNESTYWQQDNHQSVQFEDLVHDLNQRLDAEAPCMILSIDSEVWLSVDNEKQQLNKIEGDWLRSGVHCSDV